MSWCFGNRNDKGQLNSEGYPALLEFNENGSLLSAAWYLSNRLHRDFDLPAFVLYNENNSLSEISWLRNGNYSRGGDLPVTLIFFESGRLKSEEWWDPMVDGFHRITGPCIIEYDENGVIVNEKYYLNDVELSRSDWLSDSWVIEYFRKLKNESNGVIVSDVSF